MKKGNAVLLKDIQQLFQEREGSTEGLERGAGETPPTPVQCNSWRPGSERINSDYDWSKKAPLLSEVIKSDEFV